MALLASLFGLGWWAGRSRATADLYSNLDLFVEVIHKVEENYVDRVDTSKLIDGALKGMLRQLDPYSQYLDTREYSSLEDVTHGHFGGIGVVVGVRDGYPRVISPIEGSPAWQAGIRSGDIFVRIEGKSSSGMTVEDVANLLRGPEGSKVEISVRREGEEAEKDYELTRSDIVTKSVPYAFVADDGVGYLRLSNFSETSGAEVRAGLDQLRAHGARSLVLDLRLNPGGLLDQAVDVAEQFLPKGTLVVYTRGRSHSQDSRFYASGGKPELQWPMAVLVDGGTASASEIVAGALQDRDRALVVGHTSFGKGSVQSVFPLRGQAAALKLTTALYYTPSGRSIHRLTHTADEADADDDEDSGPASDSAAAKPDTADRPVFTTAAGRVVYGGGGITPDVSVTPDSLPSLASRVEERGLAFRFANRWINAHPGTPATTTVTEPMWKEFQDFVAGEKVTGTEAQWSEQRPVLSRAVARELARRAGGDAAAARVALAGDPVFQRARAVLTRSRAARDVFASADVAVDSRPPLGRPVPAPAAHPRHPDARKAPARGGKSSRSSS